MHDITEPLRLAVGSHTAGSGKGCAMNLVSWESGDTTITDLPDCADPMLARIVQRLNDNYCTHRDGDLLCPACSLVVLELAHRTVGTGTLPLTDLERRIVWVKVAIDQARQVQHLVPDTYKDRAERALQAAEQWTTNPCEETRRNAAYAAAYAADAANAAADAAYAAADADAAYAAAYAADAAYAAAYAANAAADAADAAVPGSAELPGCAAGQMGARLSLAHRAFDLFEQLTDHARAVISDEQVVDAYARMVCTR